MALTDIKVKHAKAGIKPDGTTTSKLYKLNDEKGLYLEVPPKGSKRWRFKYRFQGKEKLLSLGIYPDVSLKAARNRRDHYRQNLAEGIDPSALRKANKQTQSTPNSLAAIACEWHSKHRLNWTDDYATRTLTRLEQELNAVKQRVQF